MTPVERKRLLSFLGKGLCKSIPVIGPLIDEGLYAQFKDHVLAKACLARDHDLEAAARLFPKLQVADLQSVVDSLASHSQIHFRRIATILFEQHHDLTTELDERCDGVVAMLDTRGMLTELRSKLRDQQSLRATLNRYEFARQQWIDHISDQRKLLDRIPPGHTAVANLLGVYSGLWICATY